MKSFYFVLILTLLAGTSFAFSPQSDSLSVQKRMNIAEKAVYNGNYEQAIEHYEALLRDDPDNPVLNFYLGYCYLNTTQNKDKATKYLKKSTVAVPEEALDESYFTWMKRASVLDDVPIESKYYLGKAYQVNYKFQEAIDVYNELLGRLTGDKKIERKYEPMINQIHRDIEICKNGIDLTKHRVEMAVTNLEALNTQYSDHSPVVSADQKTIIFTSMREGNAGNERKDGQYPEDVFISQKNEDGQWSAPSRIGSINSKDNEATISVTVDGKQLYIYKEVRGGDIYFSKTEDFKNWSEPEALPKKTINTRKRETHATISADGQYLYFASDRTRQKQEGKLFKQKIGEGGLDLYVSKKLPDGTWGIPKNLGPKINTQHDENGPFIHPNGSLYFSSQGHKTMGGYDLFASTPDEQGNWTEPQNVGYPISTTEDDIFYVVSPGGYTAYYSSNQMKNDSKGRSDIYMIGYADDNLANIAAFAGNVQLCDDKSPSQVTVTVTDPETEEVIGVYTPDQEQGQFVMLLTPKDKYYITYEANEYETVKDSLAVEHEDAFLNRRQKVELSSVTLCQPDTGFAEYDIMVQNVKFGLDEDFIDKEEQPGVYDQLDQFADFLIKNPNVKIEVHGHCCERGTDKYNMGLSNRRANFIKNYLVKQGVKKENIETKNFGYHKPIAINRNPDGSWREETMQFNRRVEFIIDDSADFRIRVKQLPVPEDGKINKAL